MSVIDQKLARTVPSKYFYLLHTSVSCIGMGMLLVSKFKVACHVRLLQLRDLILWQMLCTSLLPTICQLKFGIIFQLAVREQHGAGKEGATTMITQFLSNWRD